MADDAKDVVLEALEQIIREQSATGLRDREITSRLGRIESAIARIGRYQAENYEAIVTIRAAIDRLAIRVELIEHRLERDA